MRHDSHYVEELAASRNVIGRTISINKIEPNPEQPRTEIGDLTELVASVREKGILEPLLVKPLKSLDKWLIIAGERRWRAALQAGLQEVPCIELDVSEREIAEIALIENLQRKDLTVWEEADALAALSKKFGYTHEEIARKIGKSRSTITESMTIAGLPQNIREQCQRVGVASKSAILNIARQLDDEAALKAIENIKNLNEQKAAEQANENKPLVENRNTVAGNSGRQNDSFQALSKFPLRVVSYTPPQRNYKFELKLKKPAEKQEIINILREILAELESENRSEEAG